MSGARATAFYREVAVARRVWTVRDAGGSPAPKNSRGVRAQPFWSSLSRVERIIKRVPAYRGFSPVEISLEEFCERWLRDLAAKRMEVGVNWSGTAATGYDLAPNIVREAIEWHVQNA